ncbi:MULTISPECIES: YbhB/YbcL family Raf kinase inhibitor-like protein [Salinibaculum]|uniref:YbhB/YbcL family Raf kinase inhibitor-like protein n=1 Tax=Salinibaculum TaxID=2732368 RepID=UPI0036072835
MTKLTLSSSAFDGGEPIPRCYGYTQANTSPPLTVEGVPDDAVSLALVMDDPDAKPIAGKIWTHWILWNVPPDTTEIPEGECPAEAVTGRNDWDEPGYGGPNPPDGEHSYRFRLYALDTDLDLAKTATGAALQEAIADHIVEQTLLEGTYAP